MADGKATPKATLAARTGESEWEDVAPSEWEDVQGPGFDRGEAMGNLQRTAASADPRTGQGMEARSQLQSRTQMQQPVIDEANRQEAQRLKLGERMNRASRSPTPFTNAASAVLAPEGSLRALAGSRLGSRVGERLYPQGGYGKLAGGVVGSMAGGLPSSERLSQIEPITPTQFKPSWLGGFGLKLRNEPPAPGPQYAPEFMEREMPQQEEFAGEEAPGPPIERDATRMNKPYAGEGPEINPQPTATSITSPSIARQQPIGPEPGLPQGNPTPFGQRVAAGGAEPLIQTPEEWQSSDLRQRIAERLARERGSQYAGGVRTAGPNRPANRLFPRRQQ